MLIVEVEHIFLHLETRTYPVCYPKHLTFKYSYIAILLVVSEEMPF